MRISDWSSDVCSSDLPEIAFELSSSAMLSGTLAPSEIEIIAPRIRLQRDREGRISFGGETAAPDQAGSGDLALDGIIRELLAERRPGNALSYLDEVRIRDGQVFMRDDRLGLSWAAPAAEISQ